MSSGFQLVMGQEGSYTVTVRGGVTLVRGSMPVDHFTALSKLAGKKGVMSHYVAQLAGVQLAWGRADCVDKLAKQLKEHILAERPQMTPLERWLAVGFRGRSSNAIVGKLRGVWVEDLTAHPCDPSDLWTCVALLDEVPGLREDMQAMAGASVSWGALLSEWEALEKLLREEAGESWSAGKGSKSPRTYEAMKRLLEGAKVVAPGQGGQDA